MYVDGDLSAQNISSKTADNYVGYWRFGGDVNETIAYKMLGEIDDIAIWNRTKNSKGKCQNQKSKILRTTTTPPTPA